MLGTPLLGLGLLQVLHVEVAALLLGVPASRALPRLTEGSKVPGTGGVVGRVVQLSELLEIEYNIYYYDNNLITSVQLSQRAANSQ